MKLQVSIKNIRFWRCVVEHLYEDSSAGAVMNYSEGCIGLQGLLDFLRKTTGL